MQNTKFIHTKIGKHKNKRFTNLIIIFITILLGVGSIFTFAGLLLWSGIANNTQVINRILISMDSTDNILTRVYDINYTGGKIKIYPNKIDSSIQKDKYRASGNDWKMMSLDMQADGNSGRDIVFIEKAFFNYILSGLVSTGAQGLPGITGAQGLPGITGAQGLPGSTGAQGLPGITGAQGLQGNTGAQGLPGITGAQGPQGITGATGPQGNTGVGTDNLGNHIAENNLIMGSHYISSNGDLNKGINFDNNNNLYISQETIADGTILTYKTLEIGNDGPSGCSQTNSGEMRFWNGCFEGCDGQSRVIFGNCVHPNICQGYLPPNSIPTSPYNSGTRHYALNSGNCSYICASGFAATLTGLCIAPPAINPQMRLNDMDYGYDTIYFGGRFRDKIQIGSYLSTTILGFNIYVSSIDTSGNYLKTAIVRLFTGNYATLDQVISDKLGNVYVYGYYISGAIFDSITITGSANSLNRFIAKLDSGFNRVWVKNIRLDINSTFGQSPLNKNYMTLDNDGNIYIIANFSPSPAYNGIGTLNIDNISTGLNFNIGFPGIIVKLDPSGSIIWLKKIEILNKSIRSIYNNGSNEILVNIYTSSNIREIHNLDKINGNLTYINNINNLLGILTNGLTYYKSVNNIIYLDNNFNYSGFILISGSTVSYSDITSDNNGNLNFCGEFTNNIKIGNTNIIGFGGNTDDVFIGYKFNQQYVGERFGGTAYDKCNAITTDDDNNIYIGGFSYIDASQLQPQPLLLTGGFSPNFYIKKYLSPRTGQCTGLPISNSSRNTVNQITQYWNGSFRLPSLTGAYSITGSTTQCLFKCDGGYIYSGTTNQCIFDGRGLVGYSNDFGRGDAIDIKNQEIYIGVNYGNSISIGNMLLNGGLNSSYSIGIFKSNINGSILTGKRIIWPTTGSIIELKDLKLDNNGNIYLNGYVSGSIVYNNNIIISGAKGIFLAKFDNNLNLIRSKNTTGMGINLYHESLATDLNGNIYIIGSAFVNTITIDSLSLSNISNPFSFIAKFDQNGNILRLRKPYGYGYQETNQSIKIDNNGDIIAGGGVSAGNGRNIFISKFDQNGNNIRQKLFSNYQNANAWDLDSMSYDINGNIYILSRPGSYNISKFDSLGNLLRENLTPGGMSTNIYGSIMTDNNNIYICGKKIGVYGAKFDINGNILGFADAITYNMSYCAESVIDNSSNIYMIGGYANTYLNFDNTYYFTGGAYNVIFMKIPAGYDF